MKLVATVIASLFALGLIVGCGDNTPQVGGGSDKDPVHEATKNTPRAAGDTKGEQPKEAKQPMGEPPKSGGSGE